MVPRKRRRKPCKKKQVRNPVTKRCRKRKRKYVKRKPIKQRRKVNRKRKAAPQKTKRRTPKRGGGSGKTLASYKYRVPSGACPPRYQPQNHACSRGTSWYQTQKGQECCKVGKGNRIPSQPQINTAMANYRQRQALRMTNPGSFNALYRTPFQYPVKPNPN